MLECSAMKDGMSRHRREFRPLARMAGLAPCGDALLFLNPGRDILLANKDSEGPVGTSDDYGGFEM